MRLSPRTREVLQTMVDHADEHEGTLTHATPGGWWLGDEQVGGQIGYHLLRLCLITEESYCSDDVKHYRLNEEGRSVLTDPNYLPMILVKLAGESPE
jgi:hypothetical protein